VGAFLIGVSLLVFMWNFLTSRKRGEIAGPDPWGGATLEWSIPSPPPAYNFATVPTVHSLDPLWAKDGAEISRVANQKSGAIHMPPNSYWPAVSALGMTMLMSGMVFGWWVGIPGLVIMLVGLYSWAFEPCH
jgi:heme/copper-type cytochrome/quinol oxidase subunit 1